VLKIVLTDGPDRAFILGFPVSAARQPGQHVPGAKDAP
jgi:hypothetical protein